MIQNGTAEPQMISPPAARGTKMQTQPVVIAQQNGPGLLIRALYFILFGWWFSGIWAVVAWILCLTIIGLPFGLYMLNRLPQVVTLRPSRSDLVLTSTGRVIERDVPQLPFLLRALYFLLIGWWLSAVWIAIAWALNASIVGMVIGFWMFDRVPRLITLAR
jgi:uncharacterized membrane protein YccF (DUF307 family)